MRLCQSKSKFRNMMGCSLMFLPTAVNFIASSVGLIMIAYLLIVEEAIGWGTVTITAYLCAGWSYAIVRLKTKLDFHMETLSLDKETFYNGADGYLGLYFNLLSEYKLFWPVTIYNDYSLLNMAFRGLDTLPELVDLSLSEGKDLYDACKAHNTTPAMYLFLRKDFLNNTDRFCSSTEEKIKQIGSEEVYEAWEHLKMGKLGEFISQRYLSTRQHNATP